MIITSKLKIKEMLKNLGVISGDIVMIHSSIYSLGRVEEGLDGFFEALIEYVGEGGGLIVPTFTYSYRRNEIFDIKNTKSAVDIGVFSEFIRKKDISVRNLDPLFSMTAVGGSAVSLIQRRANNCFGEGSVYGELFNNNVKFLGFGISYSTGLSGFMHIEKLANVPYRYDKVFSGKTKITESNTYNDIATHFIRDEDNFDFTKMNREKIGIAMQNNGVAKYINYGYGKHICLSGLSWQDFVLNELKKNALCMFGD